MNRERERERALLENLYHTSPQRGHTFPFWSFWSVHCCLFRVLSFPTTFAALLGGVGAQSGTGTSNSLRPAVCAPGGAT